MVSILFLRYDPKGKNRQNRFVPVVVSTSEFAIIFFLKFDKP